MAGKCTDSERWPSQCWDRVCGLEHPLLSGIWLAPWVQWCHLHQRLWRVVGLYTCLAIGMWRHKLSAFSVPAEPQKLCSVMKDLGEGSQLCVEGFLTLSLCVASVLAWGAPQLPPCYRCLLMKASLGVRIHSRRGGGMERWQVALPVAASVFLVPRLAL